MSDRENDDDGTCVVYDLHHREKLLEEALRECSEDLAEWIKSFYTGGTTLSIHPAEQRRYDRDMEIVMKARALLENK